MNAADTRTQGCRFAWLRVVNLFSARRRVTNDRKRQRLSVADRTVKRLADQAEAEADQLGSLEDCDARLATTLKVQSNLDNRTPHKRYIFAPPSVSSHLKSFLQTESVIKLFGTIYSKVAEIEF